MLGAASLITIIQGVKSPIYRQITCNLHTLRQIYGQISPREVIRTPPGRLFPRRHGAASQRLSLSDAKERRRRRRQRGRHGEDRGYIVR